MERARLALKTNTTISLSYVNLLALQISGDAEGISYLSLGLDPDPKALYRIIVGKILDVVDLELTAMWSVFFEHLTAGVYQGFDAGDWILIQHKTTEAAVTVKSGVTLAISEVIER